LKKYLYILCFTLIISISLTGQVQSRMPSQNQKTFEQKALERQLSYAQSSEKRGDIAAAYNSYFQMIKKYDSESRVISGFIDLSVKTGRIKECEKMLKDIAVKYPLKSGRLNKSVSSDTLPLTVRGFLAELFLRTSREESAYQIFTEIEKADIDKHFLAEIKASAFLRAGSFQTAERLYLSLRKESKNDGYYSEELYHIYQGLNKLSRSVNELLKMTGSYGSEENSKQDAGSFNPVAELFRLYETSEFRDSILQAAEKLPGSERNSILLSDLYFNSGSYEKAFNIIKNSASGKNINHLSADYAVRLYGEKKYSEACSFFELAMQSQDLRKTDDFVILYLQCLDLSGQSLKAVGVLKKSEIKNKELILAEMYHNRLDSLSEADRLYKSYLTDNKSHSEYWKDYIRLKIALRDYKSAKSLLSRVFEKQIIEIFTHTGFYDFKYMEAVLDLLGGDIKSFHVKADMLIRDDFISDLDNDLFKISSDVKAAGDDIELMAVYLEVLSHRTDGNFKLGGIYNNYTDETPSERRVLIYETNLYILIAKNNTEKIAELLNEMIAKNQVNNTAAKMFSEYSKQHKNDERINGVLMLLLKSGISVDIKTEIREIIRDKKLS
jgi:hypothetical protein